MAGHARHERLSAGLTPELLDLHRQNVNARHLLVEELYDLSKRIRYRIRYE